MLLLIGKGYITFKMQTNIGIIYYCVILRLIAGRKGAGKYAKPPILSCQFTLHQENCIMGSNLKSLNYTSNYSSHTHKINIATRIK